MKALIERLNKIQRELVAPKGQEDASGRFQYRTAEDLMAAVKPLLGMRFVILLTHDLIEIGGKVYFKCTAAITDGEQSLTSNGWAKEPIAIMKMSDPQVSGSCQSYAAKYALQALLLTDANKDIDATAQYQEELEDFTTSFEEGTPFAFFMLTASLEPEVWKAVWHMYKQQSIPKGEIQTYRQRMKDRQDEGRMEALAALEAFDSEEPGIAEEALAEYSTDEQTFIRRLVGRS